MTDRIPDGQDWAERAAELRAAADWIDQHLDVFGGSHFQIDFGKHGDNRASIAIFPDTVEETRAVLLLLADRRKSFNSVHALTDDDDFPGRQVSVFPAKQPVVTEFGPYEDLL